MKKTIKVEVGDYNRVDYVDKEDYGLPITKPVKDRIKDIKEIL